MRRWIFKETLEPWKRLWEGDEEVDEGIVGSSILLGSSGMMRSIDSEGVQGGWSRMRRDICEGMGEMKRGLRLNYRKE